MNIKMKSLYIDTKWYIFAIVSGRDLTTITTTTSITTMAAGKGGGSKRGNQQ